LYGLLLSIKSWAKSKKVKLCIAIRKHYTRIDQIIELIQESEAKFSPLEWADSFLSAYRKCIPNGKHFKYSAKVLMLPAFRQYYWLKVIESNDANDEIALDEIVKENSSLEQLHKRRKAGLHVSDLEPQALNREFKKIWII